jgi:predicted DCC family thiol-disulfide oxidoreductase YuxK
MLIWDGTCGFCNYWVARWKALTGDAVLYVPYQEVAHEISDIPVQAFKEAVRMIETDGKVCDGAGAAYKTLTYSEKWRFLYPCYKRFFFFRKVSDRSYQFIADNRRFMLTLTKLFFGKNPNRMAHYWAIYLAIGLLLLLFSILS